MITLSAVVIGLGLIAAMLFSAAVTGNPYLLPLIIAEIISGFFLGRLAMKLAHAIAIRWIAKHG